MRKIDPGVILKSVRLARSMTLKDLSAATGVAIGSLSNLETGKPVSDNIVETVSSFLGISLPELTVAVARQEKQGDDRLEEALGIVAISFVKFVRNTTDRILDRLEHRKD